MDRDQAETSEFTEYEGLLVYVFFENGCYGDIKEAKAWIKNVSPEKRYKMTRSTRYSKGQYPLLSAVKYNQLEFAKLLINECGANFDELFVADEHLLIGGCFSRATKLMSPLDVAIWNNRTDIVEYLVGIGADVNRAANDEATMVKACSTGSLSTIRLLLDHGASVNAAEAGGRTCLMAAVCDVDLCRFLIGIGADFRRTDSCGDTALHYAAKSNYISTVKFLLDTGADALCKNASGIDALHVACYNGCEETVDFLTERVFTDVNRHIEALQFLSSSLFCARKVRNALSAWTKAIELSTKHGIVASVTTLSMPFGTVVEATTLSELDVLSQNPDQVYLQSIVLAYKLYGPTHPRFFCAIYFSMKYLIDTASTERWLHQAIYFLEMSQNRNLDIQRRRSEMESLWFGMDWGIDTIRRIKHTIDFDLAYDLLNRLAEKAISCSFAEETEILIKLIVKVSLLFAYVNCDNRQKMEFQKLLRVVIRTYPGGKFLIPALLGADDLPCVDVISTLLKCGADANERDEEGNNVLHILARHISWDIDVLRKLAIMLVESGVHLDARNKQDERAVEDNRFWRYLWLDIHPPINLMCSAARAIRRLNIRFEGILPQFLIDFVEMH